MEQQKSTTNLAVPKPHKSWQPMAVKMKQQEAPAKAKTLDDDLSENIEALKEQVELAIKSVDENLIDSMLVGQTKIQKNKAVILSWSLDQTSPHHSGDSEERKVVENNNLTDLSEPEEDGIVLYVAIKMKKKNLKDSGETSESETDDWNNNEYPSDLEQGGDSQTALSESQPEICMTKDGGDNSVECRL